MGHKTKPRATSVMMLQPPEYLSYCSLSGPTTSTSDCSFCYFDSCLPLSISQMFPCSSLSIPVSVQIASGWGHCTRLLAVPFIFIYSVPAIQCFLFQMKNAENSLKDLFSDSFRWKTSSLSWSTRLCRPASCLLPPCQSAAPIPNLCFTAQPY